MKVLELGITDYKECLKLQKDIVAKVKKGEACEHILITEHKPVITIGRSGTKKNLLVSEEFLKSKSVQLVETDRGGDITYHGPGQIVIYPILDLKKRDKDVHKHLHRLEDMVIGLLKEYGIEGFKIEGKTGVWTEQGKIASIGIGVSGWVTFHGVAININCDLTPFGWINPCGFKDIKVTSMQALAVDKEQLKQQLISKFGFCNARC
ncbi:MAG: lipoyl(octanoyl) transferase LipB [Candidatus Omnitrophota bacterium]